MPRILYYIDGPWHTAEQLAEGRAIGAVFRNARLATRPEPCDYVAGAVPACCSHLPVYSGTPEPPAEPVTPPAAAGRGDDPPPVDDDPPKPPRHLKKRRKHPSPEVQHGPDD